MNPAMVHARALAVPCPRCSAPKNVNCAVRNLGGNGDVQGMEMSVCFRRLARAGLAPEDAPDEAVADAIRQGIEEMADALRPAPLEPGCFREVRIEARGTAVVVTSYLGEHSVGGHGFELGDEDTALKLASLMRELVRSRCKVRS